MPTLEFTPSLARQVACPAGEYTGSTVSEVLESAFARSQETRGCVLDDQGGVRKHVTVFVSGTQIVEGVDGPIAATARGW